MRHNHSPRRIGLSWTLVALLLATTFVALPPVSGAQRATAQAGTAVFVNELHYDNTGTDAGEAIEIAGPAGTDLTGWSLVLYNGAYGTVYNTTGLSGTIPDQQAGYGTASFSYPVNGIQNGAPDAIALVDASSTVLQFLSYEGTFVAVDGPAVGMTSIDIGVSEGDTTPAGYSLQLSGTGAVYEDFVWNAPAPHTFGAVNTGQTFEAPGLAVSKTAPSLVAPGEDFTYIITATNGTALGLTNLVITDTVPANATFLSASDGGTFDGSVVEWTVPGPVAAGASVQRSFQVTASETNGVTIVNDDYGAVADEWTTPAMGSPVTTEVWESIPTDIQVVKSGLTIAAPGEVLTYTLVVSNTSATDAVGVVLTDTLPSGTVYVSDDIGTPSNPEEGVYVWQLGDLPAATGATYHLVVQIDAGLTSGAALLNTAEVSTETDESDLADNSDDWTTTVYQVLPIADARLLASQYVMVEGTVTAEPGIFVDSGTSRKLYMEDDTGGILVYLASGLQPVARGNKVRVAGQIQEYRTETELVPASTNEVLDLGPATPVTPAQVDTGAVDESMEGELLQVSGLIVAKPVAWILHVDDGSGIVEIYRYINLGLDTDPHYIDYTPYEVGDYISATGPSRGYETSGVVYRQILPRGPEDIEELAAANLSIAKDVEPQADVALGGVVTYTITLSNTGSAAATGIDLVDLLPVEVTFGGWVEQSGATETAGTIAWSGDLAAGTSLTIVFTATVSSNPALAGETITNFASFTGAGDSGEDSAAFVLRPLFRIYLPVVFNNYTP